ncbi:DNA-binding transcriptional LysR family regulator [Paenibacillus cellulosilyticus]|uniref:DNA-binding transcriptional LysR family regulator n=1 Tax=Paenibacillus cellulosilyticus TaxID=375489 RepID=A0A2V2YYA5_9BACL|nr:LysR family transcriptional regulator [Paenibacillus cellulosilyticus]PWV97947.1 DNA-binding transcriptional LysR family regulator [Paenibacillus cellulosilyticus]QKS44019.1 LysR family transcriptional regulator [Paenibacillus cellulosilyticus]
MELTYLHTFREVAVRQSITKAAEALGYAQSSVTTQIQKLERAYDVQLFERFGKGLRLTTAGEELLVIATQMLDLYQQSKEKLAQQGGGTLTIGTIDSLAAYYLPPFIQRIRELQPGLSIRVQPENEPAILNKVREGELDIGLLLDEHHEPTANDPSLKWIKLRPEPLVIVARPDHALANAEQRSLTLPDLADQEWMMTEDSCNYRILLEKMMRSQSIPYRIGLELGNPEAIKRCVRAGSGIAILPRMAAEEELRRGELAALPVQHHELSLSLLLVYHPKKWMSRATQQFIELLQ